MVVPVALTIAGSDPSGGAGVQADLKTFSALGVYGTAVVTALTAQNTRGVAGVHPVPAEFVARQLTTLVDDVRVDAVKVGMLGSAAVADVVGAFLATCPCDVVVLDPVMAATSGAALLDADAVEAVRRLLPLTGLVTPNLAEAARLLGAGEASDVREMREQARRLLAAGARRVLLTGGHLAGDPVDVLAGPEGVSELVAPRVATANTHGTGCALSSAAATLRLRCRGWPEAVAAAKAWLTGAIAAADDLDVGSGAGPVHHFHALWPSDWRSTTSPGWQDRDTQTGIVCPSSGSGCDIG